MLWCSWIPHPDYEELCFPAPVLDLDSLPRPAQTADAIQSSAAATDIAGIGRLRKLIPIGINARNVYCQTGLYTRFKAIPHSAPVRELLRHILGT
jgi:hypothetical protein